MAVMASARVLREVILTPERTLKGNVVNEECTGLQARAASLLGFKLIGENQICVMHDPFICRYHIIIDI
jgi:hypothetical protein